MRSTIMVGGYINLILFVWAVLGGMCLAIRPGVRVAAGVLFVGVALLPVMDYGAEPLHISDRIGIVLPQSAWLTSAATTGLALLAGCLAGTFRSRLSGDEQRPTLPARRGSVRGEDLAVGLWCLLPLVSMMRNGGGVGQAFADAGYLIAAWAGPYVSFRACGGGLRDLRGLAVGWAAAGVLLLPLAVAESLRPAFVYELVYGYQPYAQDGPERYIGYRPQLFFEHGNQYGMFIASAALAGIGCWLAAGKGSRWRPVAAVAAALLGVATVASQSAGAVILYFVGAVALLVPRVRWFVGLAGAALVVVLGYVALRGSGIIDVREAVERLPAAAWLRDWLKGIGRGSFGWRLKLEDVYLDLALQRPIIGWGTWDWWRAADAGARPWGLWLLALGMYGFSGLVLMLSILLGPVVRVFARQRVLLRDPIVRLWVVLLLVNLADALLNSTLLITPLAAGAGALVALSADQAASDADGAAAG